MKRDSSSSSSVGGVCSSCRSEDRWIVHHVHHRSTYRRLCTACVLKLNNTSYCPICFALHNNNNSSNTTTTTTTNNNNNLPKSQSSLVCFKCNSRSHAGCVSPNTPKSPYLCPCCSNPHLKLFDFKRPINTNNNNNNNNNNNQVIDLKSSNVFLCAAIIAENSLKEAAEQARVQAERKAKEAVAARKRAKDALERTALVWARDESLNTNTNINGNGNLTNNGAALAPAASASR